MDPGRLKPALSDPIPSFCLPSEESMSTTVLAEKKTGLRTADYIALEERYGAHNYHPLDVLVTRGEAVCVWDVDGRKYLDFLAAYSAVNQGHCHPEILNAAIGQARNVT